MRKGVIINVAKDTRKWVAIYVRKAFRLKAVTKPFQRFSAMCFWICAGSGIFRKTKEA